jgi:methionyl-tRNA synthetase
MNRSPRFYTTTSIPYVNASPHLGHAMEYVQTDVVSRWHRQLGEDVFFLTGADENSLKNVRAAEAEGIPTSELVQRNTERFLELIHALGVTHDGFIRTVSPEHFAGCQKLWSSCRPEDIYKKAYHGLYCVGCEAFYSEDELSEGKCPEHQRVPEPVEEINYFFRLSNYQERLERLITTGEYKIIPDTRRNEILSFIRMGLQDFSISRSRARAREWGVPVPGDPSQVMYVWFDALSNYITGLGYGSETTALYEKYWPADVHVIGKGIIRFHAVYWPAMLLSAGLPLPRSLFVHGYINLGGTKMSKTLGTVIDPFELVERYGTETVRYYLMRGVHPTQDSDFNVEQLEQGYTAELANGIGNLLSRSLAMIERNAGGVIRKVPCDGADEQAVIVKFAQVFAAYEMLMASFDFSQALDRVWEAEATLDRYINDRKPWDLAKDPARADELASVFYLLAEGLRMLGSLMYATLPETAAEIWRRLGLEREQLSVSWEDQKRWGFLPGGLHVQKGTPLFPRLAS